MHKECDTNEEEMVEVTIRCGDMAYIFLKEVNIMKKVFVSVPMSGKTNEEINLLIHKTELEYLVNYDGKEEIEFIHNNDGLVEKVLDPSRAKIPNLVYMGVAIQRMANCDEVIFAEGWENARGCRVEKLIYDLYFASETTDVVEPKKEGLVNGK